MHVGCGLTNSSNLRDVDSTYVLILSKTKKGSEAAMIAGIT